jgi:hypothetical protein
MLLCTAMPSVTLILEGPVQCVLQFLAKPFLLEWKYTLQVLGLGVIKHVASITLAFCALFSYC